MVKDHKNLTAAELRQTMKDLAKEKGPNGESIFQGYASLVVCLLSHGDQGTVCGVDNEKVNVVELQYEIFNSESCPELSDKPKIFIIQACQGDKKTLYDPPVDSNDSINQSSASAIEPIEPRPMGPPSSGSGTPTKRAHRLEERVPLDDQEKFNHGGPTGPKRTKNSLSSATAGIC